MASDAGLNRVSDLVARSEGSLLAAATGDALGWPVEPRGGRVGGTRNMEPSLDFMAWDRREGGRFAPFIRHVPAGTYSDDTQLTLAVARSVLCGDRWWSHLTEVELPVWTLYELGGGGAVTRAAKSWERGTPPWSLNLKLADRRKYFDAGGNGVVMRIAPHAIAAAGHDTFELAAAQIVADGAATHGHPRALVGALAAGYAMWRAIGWTGKLNYGELIDETLRHRSDWIRLPDPAIWAEDWETSADHSLDSDYVTVWDQTIEEMIDLLETVRLAMGRGSLARDSDVFEELGAYEKDGASGTRTAAVALYIASRYVTQPSAGLLAAAYARRTDTDTIAAIAGALLGAMTGSDWLKPLTRGLQDSEYIRRLAASLVQGTREPDRWSLTAERVRRRTHALLDEIELRGHVELPVFGRCHLERLEEHSTESANLIRTWWLDTEEGQQIAITRTRKKAKEQSTGSTETAPPASTRYGVARPDVYWFALPVSDLDHSVGFYRDVLRMQPTRSTSEFVRFGRNFVLEKDDLHPATVTGLVIYFDDEKIFGLVRQNLREHGVDLSEKPSHGRNVRLLFRDPDGHAVELRTRSSHDPQLPLS